VFKIVQFFLNLLQSYTGHNVHIYELKLLTVTTGLPLEQHAYHG